MKSLFNFTFKFGNFRSDRPEPASLRHVFGRALAKKIASNPLLFRGVLRLLQGWWRWRYRWWLAFKVFTAWPRIRLYHRVLRAAVFHLKWGEVLDRPGLVSFLWQGSWGSSELLDGAEWSLADHFSLEDQMDQSSPILAESQTAGFKPGLVSRGRALAFRSGPGVFGHEVLADAFPGVSHGEWSSYKNFSFWRRPVRSWYRSGDRDFSVLAPDLQVLLEAYFLNCPWHFSPTRLPGFWVERFYLLKINRDHWPTVVFSPSLVLRRLLGAEAALAVQPLLGPGRPGFLDWGNRLAASQDRRYHGWFYTDRHLYELAHADFDQNQALFWQADGDSSKGNLLERWLRAVQGSRASERLVFPVRPGQMVPVVPLLDSKYFSDLIGLSAGSLGSVGPLAVDRWGRLLYQGFGRLAQRRLSKLAGHDLYRTLRFRRRRTVSHDEAIYGAVGDLAPEFSFHSLAHHRFLRTGDGYFPNHRDYGSEAWDSRFVYQYFNRFASGPKGLTLYQRLGRYTLGQMLFRRLHREDQVQLRFDEFLSRFLDLTSSPRTLEPAAQFQWPLRHRYTARQAARIHGRHMVTSTVPLFLIHTVTRNLDVTFQDNFLENFELRDFDEQLGVMDVPGWVEWDEAGSDNYWAGLDWLDYRRSELGLTDEEAAQLGLGIHPSMFLARDNYLVHRTARQRLSDAGVPGHLRFMDRGVLDDQTSYDPMVKFGWGWLRLWQGWLWSFFRPVFAIPVLAFQFCSLIFHFFWWLGLKPVSRWFIQGVLFRIWIAALKGAIYVLRLWYRPLHPFFDALRTLTLPILVFCLGAGLADLLQPSLALLRPFNLLAFTYLWLLLAGLLAWLQLVRRRAVVAPTLGDAYALGTVTFLVLLRGFSSPSAWSASRGYNPIFSDFFQYPTVGWLFPPLRYVSRGAVLPRPISRRDDAVSAGLPHRVHCNFHRSYRHFALHHSLGLEFWQRFQHFTVPAILGQAPQGRLLRAGRPRVTSQIFRQPQLLGGHVPLWAFKRLDRLQDIRIWAVKRWVPGYGGVRSWFSVSRQSRLLRPVQLDDRLGWAQWFSDLHWPNFSGYFDRSLALYRRAAQFPFAAPATAEPSVDRVLASLQFTWLTGKLDRWSTILAPRPIHDYAGWSAFLRSCGLTYRRFPYLAYWFSLYDYRPWAETEEQADEMRRAEENGSAWWLDSHPWWLKEVDTRVHSFHFFAPLLNYRRRVRFGIPIWNDMRIPAHRLDRMPLEAFRRQRLLEFSGAYNRMFHAVRHHDGLILFHPTERYFRFRTPGHDGYVSTTMIGLGDLGHPFGLSRIWDASFWGYPWLEPEYPVGAPRLTGTLQVLDSPNRGPQGTYASSSRALSDYGHWLQVHEIFQQHSKPDWREWLQGRWQRWKILERLENQQLPARWSQFPSRYWLSSPAGYLPLDRHYSTFLQPAARLNLTEFGQAAFNYTDGFTFLDMDDDDDWREEARVGKRWFTNPLRSQLDYLRSHGGSATVRQRAIPDPLFVTPEEDLDARDLYAEGMPFLDPEVEYLQEDHPVYAHRQHPVYPVDHPWYAVWRRDLWPQQEPVESYFTRPDSTDVIQEDMLGDRSIENWLDEEDDEFVDVLEDDEDDVPSLVMGTHDQVLWARGVEDVYEDGNANLAGRYTDEEEDGRVVPPSGARWLAADHGMVFFDEEFGYPFHSQELDTLASDRGLEGYLKGLSEFYDTIDDGDYTWSPEEARQFYEELEEPDNPFNGSTANFERLPPLDTGDDFFDEHRGDYQGIPDSHDSDPELETRYFEPPMWKEKELAVDGIINPGVWMDPEEEDEEVSPVLEDLYLYKVHRPLVQAITDPMLVPGLQASVPGWALPYQRLRGSWRHGFTSASNVLRTGRMLPGPTFKPSLVHKQASLAHRLFNRGRFSQFRPLALVELEDRWPAVTNRMALGRNHAFNRLNGEGFAIPRSELVGQVLSWNNTHVADEGSSANAEGLFEARLAHRRHGYYFPYRRPYGRTFYEELVPWITDASHGDQSLPEYRQFIRHRLHYSPFHVGQLYRSLPFAISEADPPLSLRLEVTREPDYFYAVEDLRNTILQQVGEAATHRDKVQRGRHSPALARRQPLWRYHELSKFSRWSRETRIAPGTRIFAPLPPELPWIVSAKTRSQGGSAFPAVWEPLTLQTLAAGSVRGKVFHGPESNRFPAFHTDPAYVDDVEDHEEEEGERSALDDGDHLSVNTTESMTLDRYGRVEDWLRQTIHGSPVVSGSAETRLPHSALSRRYLAYSQWMDTRPAEFSLFRLLIRWHGYIWARLEKLLGPAPHIVNIPGRTYGLRPDEIWSLADHRPMAQPRQTPALLVTSHVLDWHAGRQARLAYEAVEFAPYFPQANLTALNGQRSKASPILGDGSNRVVNFLNSTTLKSQLYADASADMDQTFEDVYQSWNRLPPAEFFFRHRNFRSDRWNPIYFLLARQSQRLKLADQSPDPTAHPYGHYLEHLKHLGRLSGREDFLARLSPDAAGGPSASNPPAGVFYGFQAPWIQAQVALPQTSVGWGANRARQDLLGDSEWLAAHPVVGLRNFVPEVHHPEQRLHFLRLQLARRSLLRRRNAEDGLWGRYMATQQGHLLRMSLHQYPRLGVLDRIHLSGHWNELLLGTGSGHGLLTLRLILDNLSIIWWLINLGPFGHKILQLAIRLGFLDGAQDFSAIFNLAI